jgi:hypothetical protein
MRALADCENGTSTTCMPLRAQVLGPGCALIDKTGLAGGAKTHRCTGGVAGGLVPMDVRIHTNSMLHETTVHRRVRWVSQYPGVCCAGLMQPQPQRCADTAR